MTHQPDDPGPLADAEPDHGDAGTPISPWVIVLLVAGAVALLVAFSRIFP